MKKYLLVVFCALFLVAITGCGNKNQVVCSGSMSESGMNIKMEVTADFDSSDKLTDATVDYDLGDKTTADQYCALFKLAENADKGISISCSGTKITIKGYAQMEEDGEDSVMGKTKDEFIKMMEEQSLTCKK